MEAWLRVIGIAIILTMVLFGALVVFASPAEAHVGKVQFNNLCPGFVTPKRDGDILIRCPGRVDPIITIKGCLNPYIQPSGNNVTINCTPVAAVFIFTK